MLVASASSISPDGRGAADEVGRAVRAALGERPIDLLVAFFSPEHRDAAAAIGAALRAGLRPGALIGGSAAGVCTAREEIEDGPALSVLAACLPDTRVEVSALGVQLDAPDSPRLTGLPTPETAADGATAVSAALVLADPFTFPTEPLLQDANARTPWPPLVGGLLSGGAHPGANRLLMGDQVSDEGAVAITLRGRCGFAARVSQGCRPVGRHYVITRGQDNVIRELGGRPALAALEEVLASVDDRDRGLLRSALHLGRVVDETKSRYRSGDFLVRSVLRLDPATGAMSINDFIRRGQTVQFHVRDPDSATRDLEETLAEPLSGRPAGGALLFTCTGRGTRMFPAPHHDVGVLRRELGPTPIAGMFAAGELGPIGRANHLHGFTASIALLFDRAADA